MLRCLPLPGKGATLAPFLVHLRRDWRAHPVSYAEGNVHLAPIRSIGNQYAKTPDTE